MIGDLEERGDLNWPKCASCVRWSTCWLYSRFYVFNDDR